MLLTSPFYMLSLSSMAVSTMMALSSTNWLMIWLAMELNLISFIPIINSTSTFQETEASVKYLLVQALGSSLLIMSSMSMWMYNQNITTLNIVLLFSLLMKIGMAPCHMWYPSVMTSVAWIPALILSTWQKLAPLSIMSFVLMKTSFSLMSILAALNALTGGLMGMNQTHLRTIMAYSSITHMGWMMALIYMNMPVSTILYFTAYALLITPIFYTLYKLNNKTVSQLNSSSNKMKAQHILIPLMMLSLGGLPPLTGFFPKWFTIYLITPNSLIMLMVLIMGSLMNLYYYLNIVFSSMLSIKSLDNSWSMMTKPTASLTIFTATMCLPLIPIMMM